MRRAANLSRVVFLSWLIRRWWFWVLAPCVMLVVLALGIRVVGEVELRRQQRAALATGYFPTHDAWLDAVLPADPELELRLLDWAERVLKQVEGHRRVPLTIEQLWMPDAEPRVSTTAGQLAALEMTLAPPAEANAEASSGASVEAAPGASPLAEADLVDLGAMLDAGPVVWPVLGFIARDPDRPAALLRVRARDATFYKDLLAFRAAIGFMVQARNQQATAEQRAAAMRHLDQLLAANRAQWAGDQLKLCTALAEVRDAVHLRSWAEGSLDPAMGRAWLRESADHARLGAEYLRTMGSLALPPLAAWNRKALGFLSAGWWTRAILEDRGADPLFAPHLAALYLRRYLVVAAALEGGPLPADWQAWKSPGWLLRHSLVSHIAGPIPPAVRSIEQLNRHRMVRAAALAIDAWRGDARRTGALPADAVQAEALMGPLLHADAHLLPALRYERLSPTRFRLGIDPAGPLPAFVDPAGWLDDTGTGKPASSVAAVELKWSLELDCADGPRAGPAATSTGVP